MKSNAAEFERRLNNVIDVIKNAIEVPLLYAKLVCAILLVLGIYSLPIFFLVYLITLLPSLWAVMAIAGIALACLGILGVLAWLVMLCICVYSG